MSEKKNSQISGHETKERIPVWLYPSTLAAIDRAMQTANCKSRSEFLENAAKFYCGYISAEDAVSFLPKALVEAMRGTIQVTENRISRLLFKLAVEDAMMMNVLAAGMEVSQEDLDALRAKCVEEIKRTSGAMSFKDAMRHQRGNDA